MGQARNSTLTGTLYAVSASTCELECSPVALPSFAEGQ